MAVDRLRVAAITGAAGGIGLGMARACLDHGMKVVLADLDAGRVAETADRLRADGGDVMPYGCDVRDPEQMEGLRNAAQNEYGSVDLVCLNAGVGLARRLPACTDNDWQLLFDVNVNGVTNGIRAFLPTMIEQGSGHISATASLSGLVGDPDLVIYNGTKFAVVGLMEGLAREMQRDHPGITASVLCPGPVATELIATSSKALADAGSSGNDDDVVAEYLAAGIDPDDAGRLAIEGIRNGHFWLLPHPELTFSILDPRHQAMRQRSLHVPEDTWTDQS